MRYSSIVIMASLLVSQSLHAEPIKSIHVFYESASPVNQNTGIYPVNAQAVHLYEMDRMKKGDQALTRALQSRVDPDDARKDAKHAYTTAFSDFANSNEWEPVITELQKGARGIAEAAHLRIRKTPAIVFNEKQVVYGVYSLADAIRIYQEHQK